MTTEEEVICLRQEKQALQERVRVQQEQIEAQQAVLRPLPPFGARLDVALATLTPVGCTPATSVNAPQWRTILSFLSSTNSGQDRTSPGPFHWTYKGPCARSSCRIKRPIRECDGLEHL
jgi:hypothetical protein